MTLSLVLLYFESIQSLDFETKEFQFVALLFFFSIHDKGSSRILNS